MSSDEGTTQGDPLPGMVCYSLATLPLVKPLQVTHTDMSVRQIWYADDSGAAGQLVSTRYSRWWDDIQVQGKQYGYNTNPDKTLLLVKPENEEEASRMFADTVLAYVLSQVQPSTYLGSFCW